MRTLLVALLLANATLSLGQMLGDELPHVPAGFQISLVAKEPVVRNPCSMVFGQKGRLFVGMGPQYRNPTPTTPGDRVAILIDENSDGVFDTTKTFAEGFNCIQGLAWNGNDLWIANAPDLTVVRDTSGDDVADEYIKVYTDLGNLEHGLHGLCWGPDGRLYMSKGNSKGLTKPGRIAPKPFRDLWGVKAPDGSPDFPPPVKSTSENYKLAYQNPADDWGREGGVLVCDELGKNLEIVSRGFRNPWDIAFDSSFNFLGTDNDQDEGDRVFMPFRGSHFGWGHFWSAHWSGKNHLPTAPITGPVFHGSGTGMAYLDVPTFPKHMQGVWVFNDWLRRTTFFFQPKWEGALIQPVDGRFHELVTGGKALFKPTDIEVGPDGALYILGWGNEYGAVYQDGDQTNEGRIFKVEWMANSDDVTERDRLKTERRKLATRLERNRKTPLGQFRGVDLLKNYLGPLPVWRTNARRELQNRGRSIDWSKEELEWKARLRQQNKTFNTWTTWNSELAVLLDPNLFRHAAPDEQVNRLRAIAQYYRESRNDSGRRRAKFSNVKALVLRGLKSGVARVRLAAVLAIQESKLPMNRSLVDLAATEADRVVFYSIWQTLRRIEPQAEIENRLNDQRPGVRLASLLALAEDRKLTDLQVRPLLEDSDSRVRKVAALWLSKGKGHGLLTVRPNGGQFQRLVKVSIAAGFKPADIRYTLDGTTPTANSNRYRGAIPVAKTSVLRVGLFVNAHPVGHIAEYHFTKISQRESGSRTGIYAVESGSDRSYQVLDRGAEVGELAYSDRQYRFRKMPPALRGLIAIRTSNEDSGSKGDQFLRFRSVIPVSIFVGHDTRIATKPKWLTAKSSSFRKTDLQIETTDARFDVYQRDFEAGGITLGGNIVDGDGSGCSNYVVFIKPAGLRRLSKRTTIAEAMKLIRKGDAERGRALFFATTAAGCAKCHRTDGKGQGFGPDLQHLVKRNDAKHIVKSIVDPSDEIKEGFSMRMFLTKKGRVISGILKQETASHLSLIQPDASLVLLDRKEIEEAISTKVSPMPEFSQLLTPQQVADIAAWLLHSRK